MEVVGPTLSESTSFATSLWASKRCSHFPIKRAGAAGTGANLRSENGLKSDRLASYYNDPLYLSVSSALEFSDFFVTISAAKLRISAPAAKSLDYVV